MKLRVLLASLMLLTAFPALACDDDCDNEPAKPVVILSVSATFKEIQKTVARDVCAAQDIKVTADAVHAARRELDILLTRASAEESKSVVALRDQLSRDSDAIVDALFEEAVTIAAKDTPKRTAVIRSNLCVKYFDALF